MSDSESSQTALKRQVKDRQPPETSKSMDSLAEPEAQYESAVAILDGPEPQTSNSGLNLRNGKVGQTQSGSKIAKPIDRKKQNEEKKKGKKGKPPPDQATTSTKSQTGLADDDSDPPGKRITNRRNSFNRHTIPDEISALYEYFGKRFDQIDKELRDIKTNEKKLSDDMALILTDSQKWRDEADARMTSAEGKITANTSVTLAGNEKFKNMYSRSAV